MAFKSTTELCDVVSAFVYCAADTSAMLTSEATNDYWIPSAKISYGGWIIAMQKELTEIFGNVTPIKKILRLHKVWLPKNTPTYVYHCVYQVSIDGDMKRKSKACQGAYKGKIRWVNEVELSKFYPNSNLRSPELYEYFYMCKEQAMSMPFEQPIEITKLVNYAEYNENSFSMDKSNLYDALVSSTNVKRDVQEILFKEFMLVCYPSTYMNLVIFFKFLLPFGWGKEDAPSLFRSADIKNRNGLSFREFLYFLVALDPNTTHGGASAELRCKYMFKFFDKDRDSYLSPQEFKLFVQSTLKIRKMTNEDGEKEIVDIFRSSGWDSKHSVTLNEFLKAVSENKIKSAAQAFRSSKSIDQIVKDIGVRELKYNKKTDTVKPISSEVKAVIPIPSVYRNVVYDLAVHTVRIQKSGTAIDIDELRNVKSAMSLTALMAPAVNEQTRRQSMDIFSQKSVTNEILKGVRYLVTVNKRTKGQKPSYTWGSLDATIFCRNLITVCNQIKEVFKTEPRLKEVTSPVYVMGDFHGNVSDLLYFEKILWHIGPGLCPCNLLFLGDYVDRGPFSIEVISYLFAYKLQNTKKITLLRGNHEIREVQKMFTFYGECHLKFGEKMGTELWSSINNAFDAMPIAATIDKRVPTIFCCHGGVPPPWLCPVINAINNIPCPLYQPDTQSSLAWELMWNDPVRTKSIDDKLAMELLANEGFAVNARRGTAHVFSVEALERFLKSNQLSHFIRAHEVAQAGFNIQQKGKLMTVFSSSRYCGGLNEAACILADQGKIRILRLDTD